MLADESRLRAVSLQKLYLPRSLNEISGALREISAAGKTCVISGGRTGITGGAVPVEADTIISLIHMNHFLALGYDNSRYYIRTQPGILLSELIYALEYRSFGNFLDPDIDESRITNDYIARRIAELRFPVDPTERAAHLGGIVATNASGSRTYRYGSTRDWVRGITLVLADGRIIKIHRGDIIAQEYSFIFTEKDGSLRNIAIPHAYSPQTKRAIGYCLEPNMDCIDLFIGSEGTLGVVGELELWLQKKPLAMLGIITVLKNENAALDLVEKARNHPFLHFDAIEYFDSDALQLVHRKKVLDGSGSTIPELPSWEGYAVYLELTGTEVKLEQLFDPLYVLLDAANAPLDKTWAATTEREIERQKLFRHAIPETVNEWISNIQKRYPALHKMGTDIAVPDTALKSIFSLYRQGLRKANLQAVIFGHIGNNHVHVNVLPRNPEEMNKAATLFIEWAREAVQLGGAVSAEHGIGRLKRYLLEVQYPPEIIRAMREIRDTFDPSRLLGSGVLI